MGSNEGPTLQKMLFLSGFDDSIAGDDVQWIPEVFKKTVRTRTEEYSS
jgi:hypothetical protein